VWIGFVSGCIGCAIGMWLMTGRRQRTGTHPQADASTSGDWSPGRDEIQTLLRSLVEINSEVDARVGRHTSRIDEITQTLESDADQGRGPLLHATKLLVTANQRLQADLVSAKSELQHQRELVTSFRHESRTDALTELWNRRAFDTELHGLLSTRLREKSTFSLLLIDIDHFKRINDDHGHVNGDHVLQSVARCLKGNLQVSASVSRYGGEEFAIILRGIAELKATRIAEQLRHAVATHIILVDETGLSVTVSVGVAEATAGESSSQLIERSDQALFAAKSAGRNQCYYHDGVICCPIHVGKSAAVRC
jgi:diguanylate cyclase